MSDFLRLHGVYSPWNSLGQNTGVGNLSLLQGNQTQVSTLQADSLPAEPLGKPQWGASLIAQLVKNLPAMQETRFDSWVRKIRWRRDRLPTPVFLGFPGGSAGKESACHDGDLGSIPGLGRPPGEGKGYPLQYSGLENSMDCVIHGVAESDLTERLSLSLCPLRSSTSLLSSQISKHFTERLLP